MDMTLLTSHCDAQVRAWAGECDSRFQMLEERLHQIERLVMSFSNEFEARVIELEHQAQAAFTPSTTGSSATGISIEAQPSAKEKDDRLMTVLGLKSKVAVLESRIAMVDKDLQAEQATTQELSAKLRESLRVCEEQVAAFSAFSSITALEKLGSKLQKEVGDHCYKSAEIVLALKEQVEAQSEALKAQKPEWSNGSHDITQLKQLRADLDDEVKARCYNDAQIINRTSKEAAEIRTWSIQELARLQVEWQEQEASRHKLQKLEWRDHCRKMQATVDSVAAYVFANN